MLTIANISATRFLKNPEFSAAPRAAVRPPPPWKFSGFCPILSREHFARAMTRGTDGAESKSQPASPKGHTQPESFEPRSGAYARAQLCESKPCPMEGPDQDQAGGAAVRTRSPTGAGESKLQRFASPTSGRLSEWQRSNQAANC